jgi:cyclase
MDITRILSTTLPVPVIASGGGGTPEHFRAVFQEAHADAALAASIFHFREVDIRELKGYLRDEGIAVRR